MFLEERAIVSTSKHNLSDLRQFRVLQGNINEIILQNARFQLIYSYKWSNNLWYILIDNIDKTEIVPS